MSTYELPLNPYPETFSVSIGNVNYRCQTRWNQHLAAWVLSVRDTSNASVLENLPLVPGVDLMGQFQYLEICKGMAVVLEGTSGGDYPKYSDLGSSAHVFVTT